MPPALQRECERFRLSPREREMVLLFARGEGEKTVADKMGVSLRTVKFHSANFRRKTRSNTTASGLIQLFLPFSNQGGG